MGFGEIIVIGISVILLLWFFIGSYQNNEKIQKGFTLLQKALKPYGTLGSAIRLDPASIGAKFIEVNKDSPFSKMDVILTLIRRDNPPLFLIQRLRKRTDLLVIKAALPKVPEGEVHLFLASDTEVMKSLEGGDKKPLVFRQDLGAFKLFTRGREDPSLVEKAIGLASIQPESLSRVSFLSDVPHLLIIFRLPPAIAFKQELFNGLVSGTVEMLR